MNSDQSGRTYVARHRVISRGAPLESLRQQHHARRLTDETASRVMSRRACKCELLPVVHVNEWSGHSTLATDCRREYRSQKWILDAS